MSRTCVRASAPWLLVVVAACDPGVSSREARERAAHESAVSEQPATEHERSDRQAATEAKIAELEAQIELEKDARRPGRGHGPQLPLTVEPPIGSSGPVGSTSAKAPPPRPPCACKADDPLCDCS